MVQAEELSTREDPPKNNHLAGPVQCDDVVDQEHLREVLGVGGGGVDVAQVAHVALVRVGGAVQFLSLKKTIIVLGFFC